VEHPITDLILGTDLVVEQLRIADGEPLRSTVSGPEPRGHAIEVRVNAEDTTAGRFMPAPGKITELVAPSLPGVRFDSGYEAGDEVSPFYDGLIGKLVVWAPDRPTAIRRALSALRSTRIEGVRTTIGAAVAILGHPDYAGFRMTTQWLESHTDVLPAAGARSVDEAAAAAVDATTTGAPADGADAGRPAGDQSAVVVAGRRYVVPFHGDAASASESAFGRRCGPGALQRSSRPAVAERLHRPVAGTAVGSGPPASPRTAGRAGATGRASVPIAEWTAERNVPAGGGVTSPMQGSVVEVAVRPGQQVAAGGRLFVIEAMKMQNPVTAGEAGTVGEIFVAVGDTVRAGEMLASFDRGPGSAAGQLGG
jgi:acetyl-CoA/propionyl-CoA carboxylase biotin carboxyl carrier protein